MSLFCEVLLAEGVSHFSQNSFDDVHDENADHGVASDSEDELELDEDEGVDGDKGTVEAAHHDLEEARPHLGLVNNHLQIFES